MVAPVEIIRKSLFESQTIELGMFEAHRPASDTCGDVERQSLSVVVLPLSGVFAKHDAPGRHVIGTASHAVFVAADTPYRVSFPGRIGDRALTLRFDHALVPEQVDKGRDQALASHGLLPADAMMLRNLLWTRLAKSADRFEIEALGLDLLNASLRAIRSVSLPAQRDAHVRRARALSRVKEAVACAPAEKWTIAQLAKIANLSPFHLCHVFREMVGTSIYDYVLQERLAASLDAIVDCGGDLTTIALDAGFASHSHFTARFRTFFGCTPAALRRLARADGTDELRKIMTARRSPLAVN
jgi:AraC family transcriptional regulator